jgi:hypothetical protein
MVPDGVSANFDVVVGEEVEVQASKCGTELLGLKMNLEIWEKQFVPSTTETIVLTALGNVAEVTTSIRF